MSNRITAWALAAGVALGAAAMSNAGAADNAQPSGTNQSSSGWHDKLNRAESSVGTTVEGAANKTEKTANTVGEKAGDVAHKAGAKTSAGTHAAGAASSDAAVTSQVKAQLAAHEPDAAGVSVATSGGVVTLSGTVDSPYLRDRAGELARNAKGVKEVQNQITVPNAQ
jgi:osmotically-inducible protein OsmY